MEKSTAAMCIDATSVTSHYFPIFGDEPMNPSVAF
jgi:hypothetical protein